jgi:hypothetical protein
MGRLGGKVAYITGGARGQGASHARTFAREGADIVILDACTDLDTVRYPLAAKSDLKAVADEIDRSDVAAPAAPPRSESLLSPAAVISARSWALSACPSHPSVRCRGALSARPRSPLKRRTSHSSKRPVGRWVSPGTHRATPSVVSGGDHGDARLRRRA